MTIPTQPLKMEVLRHYAQSYDLDVMIETGTFEGDTVADLIDDFKLIYSIELDEALYNKAVKRFEFNPNVAIFNGDSAVILPILIKTVTASTLFWLDAHYSGGVTALGDTVTPILNELANIFIHAHPLSVVLIDDARLFGTQGGYPTIDKVIEGVEQCLSTHKWSIANDIIRVVPQLN